MRAFRARLALCALGVSAAGAAGVHGEEPSDQRDQTLIEQAEAAGEVIEIEADRPYIPVASKSVRDRDFELRPHPRPADILRAVPGMVVNQHAGGGKANQYFLRGFDADHGTDVALSVDGVPANMVSHGHGQGYADLNWVIPEVVRSVDVFKGTYSPRLGDFATAGAVDLRVHDALDHSSLSIGQGMFGTYRILGVGAGEALGARSLAAAELYRSDGPFDSGENYRRYSVYGNARADVGDLTTLSLAATSYMGAWHGSGQIPAREVEAGRLDRFGSIDPSDGGDSERHSVYARLESYPSSETELRALAYLVRSRLDLFSNFTFFSSDPQNGDQIEQLDDRWYAGFSGSLRVKSRVGGTPWVTTVGLQGRGDLIDTGLFGAVERRRTDARVDAGVRQASAGAFAQEDIAWTPWLRSVAGLRVDTFGFDVDDRLGDSSGKKTATRLSPKGSLVLSPDRTTDVYLNAGLGFHSNDARALVQRMDPGTPLTRAIGYEVGARGRVADRFDLAGSLWLLDLDHETVWVGDDGVTEARGPTRRMGVELEARAELFDWLIADGDVTLSRARFRQLADGENRVPLAPRLTLTAGLTARHRAGGFGRLGVRSLSDRPLTEDSFLTAEGFTLLDATVGYRTGRYEVALAVDNLLDTRWREAQFATTSRLPGEPDTMSPAPAGACPSGTRAGADDAGDFAGCEDVHFTPGSPFNAMLTARLFF